MQNIYDIIDEAKDIAAKFDSLPKCAPRDADDVARLMRLFEASGLNAVEFVRYVGYWSTTSIYQWRKGRKSDGTAWPALEQALVNAPKVKLATATPAPFVRRSPTPKPAAQRPGDVTSITVWLDSTGKEHRSEVDAKRASLAHATRHAAEQVANFETVTDDLAVTLVEAGDAVIALADAIKAEREFAAMRSR